MFNKILSFLGVLAVCGATVMSSVCDVPLMDKSYDRHVLKAGYYDDIQGHESYYISGDSDYYVFQFNSENWLDSFSNNTYDAYCSISVYPPIVYGFSSFIMGFDTYLTNDYDHYFNWIDLYQLKRSYMGSLSMCYEYEGVLTHTLLTTMHNTIDDVGIITLDYSDLYNDMIDYDFEFEELNISISVYSYGIFTVYEPLHYITPTEYNDALIMTDYALQFYWNSSGGGFTQDDLDNAYDEGYQNGKDDNDVSPDEALNWLFTPGASNIWNEAALNYLYKDFNPNGDLASQLTNIGQIIRSDAYNSGLLEIWAGTIGNWFQDDGYNQGLIDAAANVDPSEVAGNFFSRVFSGFANLLDINILGNIKIKHMLLVPIVIGILVLAFKFI